MYPTVPARWNLYRWQAGKDEILVETQAEFGVPQWLFGSSTYSFASTERLVATYIQGGNSHLATIDLKSKTLTDIPCPYTDIWGFGWLAIRFYSQEAHRWSRRRLSSLI
jgi:hypothetical protein